MITVPLAAGFPRTPARRSPSRSGSRISGGKPRGKAASRSFIAIPIISQWPVRVSLPWSARPCGHGTRAGNGMRDAGDPGQVAEPHAPEDRDGKAADARLVLPMVSDPSSP